MYTTDNNGRFHREEGGGPRHSWVPAMRPYYSHEPKIRACPATNKFYSDGVTGPFVGWGVYGTGIIPAVPDFAVKGDYGSFGLNAWVANDPARQELADHPRPDGYQIPVFVDCQWVDGLPEPYDNPPRVDGNCTWSWAGMDAELLHQPAQRVRQRRLHGSVGAADRPEGTMGIALAQAVGQGPRRGRHARWPDWMSNFEDYVVALSDSASASRRGLGQYRSCLGRRCRMGEETALGISLGLILCVALALPASADITTGLIYVDDVRLIKAIP